MSTQEKFWSHWNVAGLMAFAVAGALLGSWRFASVGALSGAVLGVIANLVVAYLETNKSPLAFFLGFTILGPVVGLVVPLNPPRRPHSRWSRIGWQSGIGRCRPRCRSGGVVDSSHCSSVLKAIVIAELMSSRSASTCPAWELP